MLYIISVFKESVLIGLFGITIDSAHELDPEQEPLQKPSYLTSVVWRSSAFQIPILLKHDLTYVLILTQFPVYPAEFV